MTVSHTKLLELLGKDISFSVIGNHEILVGDVFYSLDEIEMK